MRSFGRKNEGHCTFFPCAYLHGVFYMVLYIFFLEKIIFKPHKIVRDILLLAFTMIFLCF